MTRTGIILEQVQGRPLSLSIPNGSCCISASVVRHIYLRQGVGVGALKKVYGGG